MASRWSGRTATSGASTSAGLDSRTHASQGEQRTLALALRLAGHAVCAQIVGSDPLLLLDDVFSELDEHRSRALVEHLPAGQTLLTTAGVVPTGVVPELRLRVADGRVRTRRGLTRGTSPTATATGSAHVAPSAAG